MHILSWLGIIFLSGFAVLFLVNYFAPATAA
jgi:hypothetical protein